MPTAVGRGLTRGVGLRGVRWCVFGLLGAPGAKVGVDRSGVAVPRAGHWLRGLMFLRVDQQLDDLGDGVSLALGHSVSFWRRDPVFERLGDAGRAVQRR